jgi:hypothetical protein
MAHAHPRAVQRELSIKIVPGTEVLWFGTADQLKGEGLIPPGFEWPTDHGCKWWEAVGFRMIIVRDEKHSNGPDTWCLSRRVLDGLDLPAMPEAIERNKANMRKANSSAARLRADLFAISQRDGSFQSFKALVIGGAQ